MGELEGQSLQVFKQFIKDRVQWQGIFGKRLLKQVENKILFAEKSRKNTFVFVRHFLLPINHCLQLQQSSVPVCVTV